MKKEYRVKSEKDFQYIFDFGHSVANRQFVIYHVQKPDQDHYHVGISVGKKLGNAVKRNQIKRRIRHALRDIDCVYSFPQTADFIVIARRPVSEMDFHAIKKSLIHVLSLSGLIKTQKFPKT